MAGSAADSTTISLSHRHRQQRDPAQHRPEPPAGEIAYLLGCVAAVLLKEALPAPDLLGYLVARTNSFRSGFAFLVAGLELLVS